MLVFGFLCFFMLILNVVNAMSLSDCNKIAQELKNRYNEGKRVESNSNVQIVKKGDMVTLDLRPDRIQNKIIS